MKPIYSLLLLLPFSVFAQKVKVIGCDQASNQPLLQTKRLSVVRSEKATLSFSFASTASGLLLETNGSDWGSATIDENDPLVLTLSNGTAVKAKSTGLQSFQPDPRGNSYTHRYAIGADDLALLSRYDLVAIRKYMFTDYTDLKIPAAGAHEVKTLSAAFLNEVNSRTEATNTNAVGQLGTASQAVITDRSPTAAIKKAGKEVQPIQVKDIDDYIGEQVMFCAPVFITRFFESVNDQATILDFQGSRLASKARAIIWREDKKKWGNLPKAFFTGKQVCVRGGLYLYDNTPYIRISDKSQLQILSPLTTDEAQFFVGDSVTVTGVVEEIAYYPAVDEPVTLKLRSAAGKQAVKLVIKGGAFTQAQSPEKYYLNKTVQVSGRVEQYKNQLRLLLPNWDSLQLKMN